MDCVAPAGELPRPHGIATLLQFDDLVLHQILSWSPDAASANALLNTCSQLNAQRRDPAAAALLLVRCRSRCYDAALESLGQTCNGGAAAVVQQVVQLHRTAPKNGGTGPVSVPLRVAMLLVSAGGGDVAGVQAALPLLSKAVFAYWADSALLPAVQNGHANTFQALLETGAIAALPGSLCQQLVGRSFCYQTVRAVAKHAERLPMLQQLLLLWPHWALDPTRGLALEVAVGAGNPSAVEFLLPLVSPQPAVGLTELCIKLIISAIHSDSTATLQLLLTHWSIQGPTVVQHLYYAIAMGKVASAAFLLDRGADLDANHSMALQLAVEAHLVVDVAEKVSEAAVRAMLLMLLQRGAPVTDSVRAAAARGGRTALLEDLQRTLAG